MRWRTVCNPRHLIRLVIVFGAAAGLLLSAGSEALAKEGVKARLTKPVQTGTAPGQKLAISWTLGWTDQQGTWRPFNAMGAFVRLKSASGARPTTGFVVAAAHPDGKYSAEVEVPQGGIGGVEIGVRGSGDITFPLENSPIPAPAPTPISTGTQGATIGVAPILAGLIPVIAILVLAVALTIARRRHAPRRT